MTNIKHVATLAGVSASTVSRVLNGKSYVNETTRQKVMEAVQKTNYRPNVLAKSLKMGRSNTICLMVPSIQNLIFPEIARGVEDVARRNGFTVVLCNTDEDAAVEKAYIEKMKTRWIDGFVVCSNIGEADHICALRVEGFPLVLVNRFEERDINVLDTVAVDSFQAAYDAVQYLVHTGHRRIALAYGREELYFYRERYRGYCQALSDAGLPYEEALVMRESSGVDSFYRLTQEVMRLPQPPDAIFTTSDPKAFVVMHALHDMGVRIPEDVSVLGFDNVSLSSMVEPPLSTVAQPLYDMGAVAAKNLIHQIRYKEKNGELPPPVRNVLGVDLIVRRSTR